MRQFVSEPHDDAAHRSLLSFAVREGCLDRGAAGAGSGLAGGDRRAENGERGAPGQAEPAPEDAAQSEKAAVKEEEGEGWGRAEAEEQAACGRGSSAASKPDAVS